MEDELAIFFILGGGAALLFSLSPIGRAIADRIRGKGGGLETERIRYLQDNQDSLLEELEGIRHEIGDLQERVDFTERLMTQQRDQRGLPESSDVQD